GGAGGGAGLGAVERALRRCGRVGRARRARRYDAARARSGWLARARGRARPGPRRRRARRGRLPVRPRRGGVRSGRRRTCRRRAHGGTELGGGDVDTIVIKGGAILNGEVTVSGAKNAALPLLFSTLLTGERCVLKNVPALADIRTAMAVLEHLGARVSRSPDGHDVFVEARDVNAV